MPKLTPTQALDEIREILKRALTGRHMNYCAARVQPETINAALLLEDSASVDTDYLLPVHSPKVCSAAREMLKEQFDAARFEVDPSGGVETDVFKTCCLVVVTRIRLSLAQEAWLVELPANLGFTWSMHMVEP